MGFRALITIEDDREGNAAGKDQHLRIFFARFRNGPKPEGKLESGLEISGPARMTP
jgi:hypothetical protein